MLVDIKVTELFQEVYIKDVEITDYAEIGQIIANTRVSILNGYGNKDYAKKALKELNSGSKINASNTEKASSKQIVFISRLLMDQGIPLEGEELERVKNMTRDEASAYIKELQN